jgi:ribosomal protein S27E
MSQAQSPSSIKCPKCGSTQITAQKKGFGVGKAAVGGALLGPIGLAGGLIGSGDIKITCLNCGKAWRPGQAAPEHAYPDWFLEIFGICFLSLISSLVLWYFLDLTFKISYIISIVGFLALYICIKKDNNKLALIFLIIFIILFIGRFITKNNNDTSKINEYITTTLDIQLNYTIIQQTQNSIVVR